MLGELGSLENPRLVGMLVLAEKGIPCQDFTVIHESASDTKVS
jgi:hypothetical protein